MPYSPEHIQILYDIGVAIGTEINPYQMVNAALSTYMQRLNCIGGSVHRLRKSSGRSYRFDCICRIPRRIDNKDDYRMATDLFTKDLDHTELDTFYRDLPKVVHTPSLGYFHFMELDGFGVIVLVRQTRIEDVMISGLMPLNRKLGESCINRFSNQNYRKELEIKVAERTRELEKALKDLKESQAQIIEAEKMAALGALVAGVAHEINNPLGVGVSAVTLLSEKNRECIDLMVNGDGVDDVFFKQYLNRVSELTAILHANLDRASGLIQRFQKVAVDQSSEEYRRFNLHEYVSDVLFSLRPSYELTRHRIHLNCPSAIEISGYPGVYFQIISNLVANSIDHGFEGMAEGIVQLTFESHQGVLYFRYRDNGKGMPDTVRRRIFEPFFSTKRMRGGTGLGMHILYNLVTQVLGGQVVCSSSPGNGACFTITAPADTPVRETGPHFAHTLTRQKAGACG